MSHHPKIYNSTGLWLSTLCHFNFYISTLPVTQRTSHETRNARAVRGKRNRNREKISIYLLADYYFYRNHHLLPLLPRPPEYTVSNQKLEILKLSSDSWNHDVVTWGVKRQDEAGDDGREMKSKSKWWRTTHSRRYFNSQNLIKKIRKT